MQNQETIVKRVKTVIRLHLAKLRIQARGKGPAAEVAKQTLATLARPKGIERPIVGLLNCAADYADEYRIATGKALGSDGLMSDTWADLIVAILGLAGGSGIELKVLEDYAREIVVAAGYAASMI
jgi:hypothetical protein